MRILRQRIARLLSLGSSFLKPGRAKQYALEKKVRAVAEILSCSEDAAVQWLCERAIAAAPSRPQSFYLLPDLKFRTCERINDELVRIELANGRIFTGQRSEQKQYVLHHFFSPYIPQEITGDAYKLATDIQRRYFDTSLSWYCSNGGTYIEGGCFTGMKAIRWHDLSPKPIRILAVEMGRTNFEILRKNIADNNLEKAIIPVHAGLWNESGEGVQMHSFTTRRFLEATDRWEDSMRQSEPVRLITLDDLLDEYGVDVADFANIQVNGAEIKVLQGLKRAVSRIKVLSIASYYTQDGKKNIDVIRALLDQMGCTALHESPLGRITAVTAKYRDEIEALRGVRPQRNRSNLRV